MQEQDKGNLAIRTTLLPKDTNEHGTIFGGVILSQIDLAAAIEAEQHTRHKIVTLLMREVMFKRPVFVGDLVTCYTKLINRGLKSLTITVYVEARRRNDPNEIVNVTTAEVVFVSVDDNGRSIPLDAVLMTSKWSELSDYDVTLLAYIIQRHDDPTITTELMKKLSPFAQAVADKWTDQTGKSIDRHLDHIANEIKFEALRLK